jgi:hypothetical protein
MLACAPGDLCAILNRQRNGRRPMIGPSSFTRLLPCEIADPICFRGMIVQPTMAQARP